MTPQTNIIVIIKCAKCNKIIDKIPMGTEITDVVIDYTTCISCKLIDAEMRKTDGFF